MQTLDTILAEANQTENSLAGKVQNPSLFGRISNYLRRGGNTIVKYRKPAGRVTAAAALVLLVGATAKKANAATYRVNHGQSIQSTIDNVADKAIITNNRLSHANSQSNIQYPSIQAAIDAAVDGDTIILAPGIFKGYGNRDIDFNGKAITVRSTDPNDPNIVATTIIDCNGTETEPHRGFYFHSGEDANSILAGITIINGYASGSWPDNHGGAIYCGSSPTLLKCTFSSNVAGSGGGMSVQWAYDVTINNCIFKGNSALSGGGIMSYGYGNLTLNNCIFDKNSSIFGGGIRSYDNLTLNNCIFDKNSSDYGGGIVNDDARATLINCVFNENSAEGGGGAIWNVGDGGVDWQILINCIFNKNSANGGGAILNNISSSTVINCIFNENSAEEGGAIWDYPDGYETRLINCTFFNNSANKKGGGIFNVDGLYTSIINSIFWKNFDTNGTLESSQIYSVGGYYGAPTVNYSCIQGWTGIWWPYGYNISADPLFINPNPDSNTIDSFIENGNIDEVMKYLRECYSLQPDSNCIDTGDPRYLLDPDGTRADMGAVYFDRIGNMFIRGDTNTDRNVTLEDAYPILYHLLEGRELECKDSADVDDNGKINIDDVYHLCDYLLGRVPQLPAPFSAPGYDPTHDTLVCYVCMNCGDADIDNNGNVTLVDYALLADKWLKEGPRLEADITRDAIVDFKDLNKLADNWLWQGSYTLPPGGD